MFGFWAFGEQALGQLGSDAEANNAVLVVTEAQDTASFNATARTLVQVAATEAPDVAAIAATLINRATFHTTEAPDVASFNATARTLAELDASEAPDVASFRTFAAFFFFDTGEEICVPYEPRIFSVPFEHRAATVPFRSVPVIIGEEDTDIIVPARKRGC